MYIVPGHFLLLSLTSLWNPLFSFVYRVYTITVMLCVNLFPILLDGPSILQKSTRHVIQGNDLTELTMTDNGKKHYESRQTTSSTLMIRGLLDDFCFSHSDCTLPYTICSKRTRRCQCKGGSRRTDDGRSCVLDSEARKYHKNTKINRMKHNVCRFA